MAVRADDQIPRKDNAFFWQKRMFHAHLSAFVEMRDTVLHGKFAHGLALLGRTDVLIRREMIQYQRHFIPVKNFFTTCRPEFPDGYWRGDIIA
jgi:hypothetical protein